VWDASVGGIWFPQAMPWWDGAHRWKGVTAAMLYNNGGLKGEGFYYSVGLGFE